MSLIPYTCAGSSWSVYGRCRCDVAPRQDEGQRNDTGLANPHSNNSFSRRARRGICLRCFPRLGIGQGPPGSDDYYEVSGYAVLIILPFVLLVAGAFGTVALVRMQGLSVVPPLLVGLIVIYFIIRYALGMIVHVAGNDQALRHPGAASACTVLLFLAVNIVAIYGTWSYILSARA